jgi:hypothetical protein
MKACTLLTFAVLALAPTLARADEAKLPCPTPGEKCKVLFLTEAEERLLTGQNGILDTAAQARSLDLGQFAVYFKQKLATSAAGEVRPADASGTPKP